MSDFSDALKKSWRHRESEGNVCAVCGSSSRPLAHSIIRYAQDEDAPLPDRFVPMSASFGTIRGNFPICNGCAPACDQCGLPIVTDKVLLLYGKLNDDLHSEESPILWGNGICEHHDHCDNIEDDISIEDAKREVNNSDKNKEFEDKNINSKNKEEVISKFRDEISEYEWHVFGLKMYYQTAPWWTRRFGMGSYQSIKEREKEAIMEAREILNRVESGKRSIDAIREFEWPPIPDFARGKIDTVINSYKYLFPNRGREDLSDSEIETLREEIMRRI